VKRHPFQHHADQIARQDARMPGAMRDVLSPPPAPGDLLDLVSGVRDQAQTARCTVEDFDVMVTGSMGLYAARFATPNARAWYRRHHLHLRGARTVLNGVLVVEGGDRCRDLVAGMVADGLRVEVNGVEAAP
jgi:hypothetical protein